jgi:hypothetical protein
MNPLPFRQVHLDFHTSPLIPDVGRDFNPEQFIQALQTGHVNSVTVFSRCHHGYCYYPTRIGTPHPHLARPDLLGEMIAACDRAGIRVEVYTTVVWDELAWTTHPEWRAIRPDGRVAGVSDTPLKPGWKNLCVNTGYADYVIAQACEVAETYTFDGMFIDIVNYIGSPCVCSTCLRLMAEQGIDPEDPDQLARFKLDSERRFMQRCTAALHAIQPALGTFYNSRLCIEWDHTLGNGPEMDDFSHLEIESLPGGFWGYDHFPLMVRYFQSFDQELVAMTGRFHTAWGDFGGLRHRAALEFEVFQGLAHGARVNIGDQLHPRGKMDEAVYRRIGEVFAEVEQREDWVRDSAALPEIGVITANGGPSVRGGTTPDGDLGALHILEQLKHQFSILDNHSDLAPYAVIVLPDAVPVDAALADRLRAYVAGGGGLLISNRAGLDAATNDYVLTDVMGVHYAGPADFAPDYLVLSDALAAGIEPFYHSNELRGVKLRAEPGVEVLAYSGAPYFNRTWEHFCSHLYSPFERVTDDPLIVQNGRVITLARPLLSEYAVSAKQVHKQVIANCLARLLPQPRVGAHTLPSTAIVTVRRQHADLIVHVLHYVHQRRGKTLDIIEDRFPLCDVDLSIRASRAPSSVRLQPQNRELEWTWDVGYVTLHIPRVDGYQIVQLVEAHTS